MRFKAMIATTSIDRNGEQYALSGLVMSGPAQIPVYYGFNPYMKLGDGLAIETTESAAYVYGELEDAKFQPLQEAQWFIVPGGIVREFHKEGDILVIDQFTVERFGLTRRPADSTLTPLEVLDVVDCGAQI